MVKDNNKRRLIGMTFQQIKDIVAEAALPKLHR